MPDPGLIHHSDRGSQYTSNDFQQLIKNSQALPSMSGRGNCYEFLPRGYNAVSERFFGTLKTELVPKAGYSGRAIGKSDIFAYIEGFYNRTQGEVTLTLSALEAAVVPLQ